MEKRKDIIEAITFFLNTNKDKIHVNYLSETSNHSVLINSSFRLEKEALSRFLSLDGFEWIAFDINFVEYGTWPIMIRYK